MVATYNGNLIQRSSPTTDPPMLVMKRLRAAIQEERIHSWKEHFKNLLGKPPKVTYKPITKIINDQLDIKVGQFTQVELDVILTKIKSRKATGLDEIPPEVWKTRKFDDVLLQYRNAEYNQNTIDRWTKGCILLFPKKGDLGIPRTIKVKPYFHSN